MVITLTTAKLIESIKSISHREVAEIPDIDARYRAEAGSEKMEEINRCLTEALGRLTHRCNRFLIESYSSGANDTVSMSASYNFEFNFTERRAANKAEPLAAAMHDFVVEYALSKFYSYVSQGELSNKHAMQAISTGNLLEELLYIKNPPRV